MAERGPDSPARTSGSRHPMLHTPDYAMGGATPTRTTSGHSGSSTRRHHHHHHARLESDEVFLFVNPTSGGNRGEAFMKVPQPFEVQVSEDPPRTVSLRIYNLADGKSGDKQGFHDLRRAVTRGVVRVIVGGGDGTIMWAVGEAEKHGIDVLREIYIGIVPLGTGNDFARASGWGGRNPDVRKLLAEDHELLDSMVTSWVSAVAKMHDVWRVRICTDDKRGEVRQVDHKSEEGRKLGTFIECPMVNYFSIGEESRLGYAFEKNRTKSQTCNLLVYGFEGCNYTMRCCVANGVENLVQGMYNGEGPEGRAIFQSDKETDAPHLIRNPQVLLVLNINSFGGGLSHFWPHTVRTGVDKPLDKDLLETIEDPGDGKLEVLTVKYVARLVTADVLGGRRVYQGAPLFVEFWHDDDSDVVAYCEVDGEFYKLVNPTSVAISLRQKLFVLHSTTEMTAEEDESGSDSNELSFSEIDE